MYVLQITDKKIAHSNKISMLCAQKRGGGVKLGMTTVMMNIFLPMGGQNWTPIGGQF
jgi:hypothetical protein